MDVRAWLLRWWRNRREADAKDLAFLDRFGIPGKDKAREQANLRRSIARADREIAGLDRK
jgi:hypothetical protein